MPLDARRVRHGVCQAKGLQNTLSVNVWNKGVPQREFRALPSVCVYFWQTSRLHARRAACRDRRSLGFLWRLLLPAIQAAREAARRSECQNNMKQLALGFHNFENAKREFPLSITRPIAPSTHGLNNWAPYVLPYLEEQNLIAGYDLDEDWWREPNRTIVQTQLAVLNCPSTPDKNRVQDKPETTPPNKTGACGDYFTPAGVHRDVNLVLPADQQFAAGVDLRGVICWQSDTAPVNKQNRVSDILDGTSKSIHVG